MLSPSCQIQLKKPLSQVRRASREELWAEAAIAEAPSECGQVDGDLCGRVLAIPCLAAQWREQTCQAHASSRYADRRLHRRECPARFFTAGSTDAFGHRVRRSLLSCVECCSEAPLVRVRSTSAVEGLENAARLGASLLAASLRFGSSQGGLLGTNVQHPTPVSLGLPSAWGLA